MCQWRLSGVICNFLIHPCVNETEIAPAEQREVNLWCNAKLQAGNLQKVPRSVLYIWQ